MVLPVPGVRITAFQRNAFQNNAFQIGGNGAQYRLLCPHYSYLGLELEQLTVVTDGVEVSANWVPILEVDPLNTAAVNAYYAAGPRIFTQSRVWDNQNWKTIVVNDVWVKPVTFWFQSSPGFYKLSGLGASLAPVPGP